MYMFDKRHNERDYIKYYKKLQLRSERETTTIRNYDNS